MTVYILDEDTQQQSRRDWPFLTGETQLHLVGRNGHKLTTLPGGQELAAGASGVVFIHSSYCPPTELLHISLNYQHLVLILVSAGGIPNGPRGALFWSVGRAVSKPPVSDDYFAGRAKDFLADYRMTGKPNFQKLEPDLGPQLAFRLLCEAWLFVEGKKTVQGITIHAPANIDEWLKPFGAEVPADVVKQMGDAKKEADALFVAIMTKPDNAKIKGAVEAILRTYEKKQPT